MVARLQYRAALQQGQVEACKGHALVQQHHTEGQVQQQTDEGPESHRMGVVPHSEQGLEHYLQCM